MPTFSCIDHSPSQLQTLENVAMNIDLGPVVAELRELTKAIKAMKVEPTPVTILVPETPAPIVNVQASPVPVSVTVPDIPTPQVEVFPALTVPELKANITVETKRRMDIALVVLLVANLFATYTELGVFHWLANLLGLGS